MNRPWLSRLRSHKVVGGVAQWRRGAGKPSERCGAKRRPKIAGSTLKGFGSTDA